jgi:uncharacterized protein (DUF2236 family)
MSLLRSLSIPDLLRWVAATFPGGAVPAARAFLFSRG